GEKAPDALGRQQHGRDGDRAQHEKIKTAEVGQRLPQQEKDDGADDRPFYPADAADHRDEDDEGGPIVDAEGGVGGDPQLLQEDQGADHGRAEGGQHVDDELGAGDVDAVRARRQPVLANGGGRGSRNGTIAASTTTTRASATQYIRNSRSCRVGAISITIAAGKLIPEPPPSAEICEAIRRKTSATTQVPMAK